MFLRRTERKKNGKTHHYWNVVENKRLGDGRVVQRHVLYLGEINSSQAVAWRKAIEVFDEDAGRSRTLALFPEDRCEAVAGDASVVQLRLSEMQLRRPRQLGAGASARPVLGRSFAAEPKEDTVGSDSAGARQLSADRAGQRVAAASPMVRHQRDGRFAGSRLRIGGRAQALCLSRSAARAQGSVILASGRAL